MNFKTIACSIIFGGAAFISNAQSNDLSEGWTLSPSKAKISGYVQGGYQHDFRLAGSTASASTFKILRTRLIASGSLSERVSYVSQLEGYSTSRDQQGKSLITILDLFANIKLSSWATLTVGQFALPITYDTSDIGPGFLETPDISLIGANIACGNSLNGASTYAREIGVKLSGDIIKSRDGVARLKYILALTNGAQSNSIDDNKAKDITARLQYTPLDGLSVYGAVRRGTSYVPTHSHEATRTTYSVAINYDKDNLMVRIEGAKDEGEFGSAAPHLSHLLQSEQGAYVTLGYRFGSFMPVVRYDGYEILNSDLTDTTYGQNQASVGFLWTPLKYLRVQTYYTIGSKDIAPASGYSSTYDRLQIMLGIYF